MLTRQTALLLLMAVVMLFWFVPDVRPQSDTPSLEIGAQFSIININDFGTSKTEPGFGGRITYNATDNVALESEFNFFPRDHKNDLTSFGRKLEGLVGVKIGLREQRFGVFGKARPGFIHYGRVPGVVCASTTFIDCSIDRTNFAFDAGGVVETYPSRHSIIRFDLGDTIVRSSIIGGTKITHNAQFSAGVGYRF